MNLLLNMKHARCRKWMLIWAMALPLLPRHVEAQLEVKVEKSPQTFFPDDARPIAVVVHNPSDKPVETRLRTQLYQASSSTAIPLGKPHNWKNLQVLPGQTVLESTPLTFPPIENAAHFVVQWLDEQNHVLGRTEVGVYPTNLLEALKPLAGEKPLGVFDPQNQLKPLLKGLDLSFEDLAVVGLDDFSGNLAIIGPFQSKSQMRDGLAEQIKALSKKGRAVVWIQPPLDKKDKLQPSFYSVPENQVAVVVVQPQLVADLPSNPQSQLNLIYFCQLAAHPENLFLPNQTH